MHTEYIVHVAQDTCDGAVGALRYLREGLVAFPHS